MHVLLPCQHTVVRIEYRLVFQFKLKGGNAALILSQSRTGCQSRYFYSSHIQLGVLRFAEVASALRVSIRAVK
jgi:hypothetical protein